MARSAARWTRTAVLALEGVTVFGAGVGVRGFLRGDFAPLVDDLGEALPVVDGPVLPALALAGCVGLPQAAALALGLRSDPRAAVAAGAVLAGWVAAQHPLVGWTSPLQPAFAAVGLAEVGLGLVWARATWGGGAPGSGPATLGA